VEPDSRKLAKRNSRIKRDKRLLHEPGREIDVPEPASRVREPDSLKIHGDMRSTRDSRLDRISDHAVRRVPANSALDDLLRALHENPGSAGHLYSFLSHAHDTEQKQASAIIRLTGIVRECL
jgi:hypothetical protein